MLLETPTIHLNGSSADDLMQRYRDALEAIQDAEEALAATAPNGRDYYVNGPDSFARAARQHAARVEALRSVRLELTDVTSAIMEQVGL